ncbi:MAG: glycosyltransferase family 4 protein [Capsulimonadaceae bacterium]
MNETLRTSARNALVSQPPAVAVDGNPLRLLLIGQDPSLPGGMAKCVGGLLEYLHTRRDVDVSFLNETTVKGREGMTSANQWTAVRESALLVNAFRHEIRRFRPHVIHLNVAHGLSMMEKALLARLAAGYGIPAILHVHSASFDTDLATLGRPRRLWLGGAMTAGKNRTVVLSDRLLTLLKSVFSNAKASVVVNSVTLIDPPPSHSTGPLVVGFIGFMDGRKGETTLIDALSACRNDSIRAILAGDGPARRHAEDRAAALELTERATFIGLVDGASKDRFFRDVDVLCLPSQAENLPVALLEGMSYGRPVVATPVGGVPDLVQDRANGRLVPPGQPRALAAVLDELADDRTTLHRMGSAAWQTIATGYTWDVNGPRIVELYRSCAESVRPATALTHAGTTQPACLPKD